MKLKFGILNTIRMFKDLKRLPLDPKYGYNQEYVDSIEKEIFEVDEDDLDYTTSDGGEFLIAKRNNVLVIYIKCLRTIYIFKQDMNKLWQEHFWDRKDYCSRIEINENNVKIETIYKYNLIK